MANAIRSTFLTLALLAALAPATPPAQAAVPFTLDTLPESEMDTGAMIEVASRCIGHMKAYRQAIRFIEKRLKSSPPSVTVGMSNGESITLLNRTHSIMRYEHRVLVEGMHARERACQLALLD